MRFPDQQSGDDLLVLVSRLKAGEESAWREFVDRFAPQMYAYFRREFGADHASVQDLTANTLICIIKGLPGFEYRTPQQFKAWVFVLARNAGVDNARHATAEFSLPDYLEDLANGLLEPGAEAELVDAVKEAIAQLPSASKTVVELRYIKGLNARDIAGTLQSTYGAVRVSLHRALKQLEPILRADKRILRRLRER